ncbi:MAG TPA: phytanoyl-CoA dioxygenase family protein [Pseudomonadales bacterium]
MQQQSERPVRHPWNVDFRWRIPPGPYRALSAEQARRFDEQGYVVLEDVFDPQTIAEVTAELDAYERETEEVLRRQPDGRMRIAESGAITFSIQLLRRSMRLRRFATSPILLDLCHDLIGPDVNMYWDQAVYKKPEKPRRFPWHQDNGYNYIEPQSYLTCWVALVDATVENGCPQVAPGVHRMGTLQHHYVEPLGWECFSHFDGAVAAPVRAGGIVVFSSLTPHLTGPNLTNDVRKAYILQYAPAGAKRQIGDAAAGPPTAEAPVDDPEHQFPVLRNGEPVPPPLLA